MPPIWTMEQPLIEHFMSEVTRHEVPFTNEIKTCAPCDGDGRVTCTRCHGSGKNSCSSCHGSGKKSIRVKRGDEWVEKKISCSTCHGSGKTTCCFSDCRGTGRIVCSTCRGTGKLRWYREMLRTHKTLLHEDAVDGTTHIFTYVHLYALLNLTIHYLYTIHYIL